jgi:anti-sigma factor RsiW
VSCQETQDLLHAYVDGELDLVRALQIEQHFGECPACARDVAQQQALRSALRAGSLYHELPRHLPSQVRAALRRTSNTAARTGGWSWRWLGLGAAVAGVAMLLWGIVPSWLDASAPDRLLQELIAGHVRSLMADHLMDVPSSDPHSVKPWFEGKLDFSPQVLDLRQDGFPLLGGRLDYLNNRPVAAIVYQRRQHMINVYSWPSPPETAPEVTTITRQGYHLIRWIQGGMTYWAISNLSQDELQVFTQLLQQRTAAPPS